LEGACGQYELAIMGDDPERTTARLRLAMLCSRLGRPSEGLMHLTSAEITPEVLLARAELQAGLGERDAADQAFSMAIAAAPENDRIRRLYAAALMRWGEMERAEQLLGGRGETQAST